MTQSQIALMLISGVSCLGAAIFMLYVIHLDYLKKRHNLKMFQFGFFAILLLIGILQVMSIITYFSVGFVPDKYKNLYSVAFILICFLLIPYFRYNKRKDKEHLKV